VSTVEEGSGLLLVLQHKKEKKTRTEELGDFRVFCFAFHSGEGKTGKEKQRTCRNTVSVLPPSAEKAMACANRRCRRKRVQSKQSQSSQPKVKYVAACISNGLLWSWFESDILISHLS